MQRFPRSDRSRRPPPRLAVLFLGLLHLVLAFAPNRDWVVCIEPDSSWLIEPASAGQCSNPGVGCAIASRNHDAGIAGLAGEHCGSCTDLAFRPLDPFPPGPARIQVPQLPAGHEPIPQGPVSPPVPPADRAAPASAPSCAMQFRATVTFLV